MNRSRVAASGGILLLLVGVSAATALLGWKVGRRFEDNKRCCLVPRTRNGLLSLTETLGLTTFYSQTGQDKWITEAMFPNVRNGFFLDVGSGDGVVGSNTKLLEERGWTGICVDPFPANMQGRTCQVFKEVVYNEAGEKVQFTLAGGLGGIREDLGRWKEQAAPNPTVEFTTVTLGDILERAKAPRYIHYMSLDIEGAELKALLGVPFDRYQFGSLDIEHNGEEPKRSDIRALLKQHGYQLVHSWLQDDFYAPATP